MPTPLIANQAKAIYQALGVEHNMIESRRSWQNYAETTFNVQHRKADADFKQATIWTDLVAAHEKWAQHVAYNGRVLPFTERQQSN